MFFCALRLASGLKCSEPDSTNSLSMCGFLTNQLSYFIGLNFFFSSSMCGSLIFEIGARSRLSIAFFSCYLGLVTVRSGCMKILKLHASVSVMQGTPSIWFSGTRHILLLFMNLWVLSWRWTLLMSFMDTESSIC